MNAKNVFERKSGKRGFLNKYPQQRNFEFVDGSILQSLNFRLLSVKTENNPNPGKKYNQQKFQVDFSQNTGTK